MNDIDKNLKIHTNLQIDLSFPDLEKQIKTAKNSPGILKTARETLEKIQGQWEPAILSQWFDFEIDKKTGFGRIGHDSAQTIHPILLDMGHSIKFLEQAKYVMVAAYTIGESLDIETARSSSKGNMLEAYMMDLIGLAVLEKTADRVKEQAQTQAKNHGWGVSPFLSPGSVHGWELEDQSKLCSLLPIKKIDVTITNDAVLSPLKSIIALIGIGPGYDSNKVGSTCDVCSKKDTCQMRQTH
jgi:hypothetical protein